MSTSKLQLNETNQNNLIKRAPAKLEKGSQAKIVFEGVFFKMWQWQQQLYDGSFTTFESLSRPDTVTILATTAEGEVIVTKQTQPGFKEFYSLPGGIIDEGEAVWQSAKRELLEETGYASQDWYFLFSNQMNSRIDWNSYYLIAKNCQLVAKKNLDAGEKINLELFKQDDFVQLIKKEEFRNIDFSLWFLKQAPEEARAICFD